MSRAGPLAFYEFFAGGGMARLGLGEGWECRFANDFDPLKAGVYRDNFGAHDLREGDVWALGPGDLPGRVDLAWASSPCQDFSLAGGRAGLKGGRSGAFFGFWRLVEALAGEGRAPRAVMIENVTGLLTSHGGEDFTALCRALAAAGYRFGALQIDAAAFLPQSRPRFLLAALETPPAALLGDSPFHGRAVREAHARLPDDIRNGWLWWRAPAPPVRNLDLAAVLEPDDAVRWHSIGQTARLVALMAPAHRRKLAAMQAAGGRRVAGVFRRMRTEGGERRQRAELRDDGVCGCLRTPRGGSSRQAVMVVEDGGVRSRLISGREAARLMGLPEDYRLPPSQTAALHVAGDGVAVPVVRWLAEQLLEPLLLHTPVSAAAE